MGCENCKKNKRKVMSIKVAPLSDNEIQFYERWTEVMKRPWSISSVDINYCYEKINRTGVSGNCSSCLRENARELKNRYNLLTPAYQRYTEMLKEVKKYKEEAKIRESKKVAKVKPNRKASTSVKKNKA